MARIFITGSSDGLGSLTARALVQRGHSVVLHARNDRRAHDAAAACPGAETCLVADLSDISQTKKLAEDVNQLGPFDAIIHNAGLYTGSYQATKGECPSLTAVNTLSPYILTCLINPPKRLVFISSSLHNSGDASLTDLTWEHRGERGYRDMQAYCDSKLHMVMLACAFARRWPGVKSNAIDPGWVPTKMGGRSATDDIDAAVDTYVMLAEGKGEAEEVSGKYWYQMKTRKCKGAAEDVNTQDKLLLELERITGVKAPNHSL